MVGKTYVFKNETHTIKSINHAFQDTYHVVSNLRQFQATEDQIEEDFKEVSSKEQEQTNLVISSHSARELENMNSLSDILMENIKKVQDDPQYIDRAKSINESAKNLIELKKTQLEVVKLLKG